MGDTESVQAIYDLIPGSRNIGSGTWTSMFTSCLVAVIDRLTAEKFLATLTHPFPLHSPEQYSRLVRQRSTLVPNLPARTLALVALAH